MSKTMVVDGMTAVVTGSNRTKDDGRGRSLRSVQFTLPNVAPPGADWSSNHGGRRMELVSFNGGAVEVYVFGQDGIPMYQGTVRAYFPAESGRAMLRAIWRSEQPSKVASEAFELSASAR